MIVKALGKSGRRILRAIKKISTARLAKKLRHQQERQGQQQQQQQRERMVQKQQEANLRLQAARLHESESLSPLSSSLPPLDTKSIDTYATYVAGEAFIPTECYVPHCCCHCDEREENQRNENLENEMMR